MTTSSATPCGRPPARPASRRSGRFLRCGDGALPVNRPDEPLGLADFSVNARPSFMFRGAVGQIASLGISLMTKPDGRRPDKPLLDTVSTHVDLRRLQHGLLRQRAGEMSVAMIY